MYFASQQIIITFIGDLPEFEYGHNAGSFTLLNAFLSHLVTQIAAAVQSRSSLLFMYKASLTASALIHHVA